MEPIKPEQVIQAKKASLPDEVIEAMNELIAKKWTGYSAVVTQPEFVYAIIEKMSGKMFNGREITSSVLYEENWLDIEDIYREAGWFVEYDSPAYNESYVAKFYFRANK